MNKELNSIINKYALISFHIIGLTINLFASINYRYQRYNIKYTFPIWINDLAILFCIIGLLVLIFEKRILKYLPKKKINEWGEKIV